MEASIDLNSKAYYKIMLHCLKHLTSDCYGLLLGKKEKNNKYIVNDAIPLSHDKIFGPPFKIAISMIKNYFPNEKIIGFYENLIVNQMKEEGAVSNQAQHICEIIGKDNKFEAIYFQIYSKDSGDKSKPFLKDEIFFKEFILNEENIFSFVDTKKETNEEFQQMKDYCIHNRQQDIIDFDEHLENPNLDWRNTFVE